MSRSSRRAFLAGVGAACAAMPCLGSGALVRGSVAAPATRLERDSEGTRVGGACMAPVVSLHEGWPYIDATGTAAPYLPGSAQLPGYRSVHLQPGSAPYLF